MNKTRSQTLMLVEIILLLLPLTLFMALLITVSYVAYPIPMTPMQILFDLGMLLKLLGLAAAWCLSVRYFRFGGGDLKYTHWIWLALLIGASSIGLLCALIAVEQLLMVHHPQTRVGFSLLAPAVFLIPVASHLLWERKRAG